MFKTVICTSKKENAELKGQNEMLKVVGFADQMDDDIDEAKDDTTSVENDDEKANSQDLPTKLQVPCLQQMEGDSNRRHHLRETL